ncbi:MAG: hypothetical protein PHF84_04830 [bacterium]|nr:hypothetical protein [bacterium]
MNRTILIVLFLFLALELDAGVYLNGSYETSLDIYRDDKQYKWQLDSPWHRLELRLKGDPVQGAEFYFKTYADFWTSVNSYERRDKFYLDEAHARYKVGEKDSFETYLFQRELRFWLGDPLFNLVNNDQDKWNDKKVSGLSAEVNGGIPGFWMKGFAARLYEANTDAAGIRLNEKLIRDIFHIGATATYKNWHTDRFSYNQVSSGDLWFNIYQFYLTAEMGTSRTPSLPEHQKENLAMKAELRRDFDLNGMGVGDVTLISSVRDIGRNFRAYLSKDYDDNRKFDQKGYYLETKYRVIRRAVTFTYHRDYFQRHVEDYSVTDDYFETYIEFIRGFRWKNWFQNNHELNTDRITVSRLDGSTSEISSIDNLWQHFFTQLEMENELAYVKLQFKVKNMYSDYLRYIYGTEYSINITKKMKSINRVVVVDELYRSRTSFFSQLQYRYGENTDFYLGYGNEDDTKDDLVNDDDFVESDKDIEHKIHLYVKASF